LANLPFFQEAKIRDAKVVIYVKPTNHLRQQVLATPTANSLPRKLENKDKCRERE